MGLGRTLRTLKYLRGKQIAHRLWIRGRKPFFASGLYEKHGLKPANCRAPIRDAADNWSGRADHGSRILKGQIRLINLDAPLDWKAPDQTLLWRFTLHYFEWLADLKASPDDNARKKAQHLVLDWVTSHARYDAIVWHPYPTSLRVYSWLAHWSWLTDGLSDTEQHNLVISLDRQIRHLARVLERDVGGNHLIKNLKALIAASVCLPDHRGRLDDALGELKDQLGLQILGSGCHYELSPAYHQQVLEDLIDIHDTLGTEAPDWLMACIQRMGSVLDFFRHGDGLLALFNDGHVGHPDRLEAVLAKSHCLQGDNITALPDAGYYRLDQEDVCVLLDVAHCCPDDLPAHAHADTLSFEFSHGTQRLVVNCGTFAYQDKHWRNRLRGTAFHSTAQIGQRNSAEVYGVFRLGTRPRRVHGGFDGETIMGDHDGYRKIGITHKRSLTLETPYVLSGQDSFPGCKKPGEISIRFHLHPDILVESETARSVWLKEPDGTWWHFICDEGVVGVTDSVYAPDFNVMHPTRCLTIQALPHPQASWRFERQ